MVQIGKFLTDSSSFSCIKTHNLGTYLSMELYYWKALLKLSIPSFLKPGTAIVISRGVRWTLRVGSVERVHCCIVPMDLHVQTCHLLCDALHLLHSIHLEWNYSWKIQRLDVFFTEDDDASRTAWVKHGSKIGKEALCLVKIWLGSKPLQPCDSSELWILPFIGFLVYRYMDYS